MQENISVNNALIYVKQWWNEGNHEKSIQGLREIIGFDPENVEAKNLLAEYTQIIESKKNTDEYFVNTFEITEEENNNKLKSGGIFKKLTKVLILFLFLSIGYLAYSNYGDKIENGFHKALNIFYNDNVSENSLASALDTTIDKTLNSEKKDSERNRNEIRTEDLKKISNALTEYYNNNLGYPPALSVEKELLLGNYLIEMPIDPKSGEFDEKGEAFDYFYAVYKDPISGEENQIYILSANFENDDKEDNVSLLSSRNGLKYTDYRDLSNENVAILKGYRLSTDELPLQKQNSIERNLKNNILDLSTLSPLEIQSDDEQRRNDVITLKKALKSYYNDNLTYPDADIIEPLLNEYLDDVPEEKYNLFQNEEGRLYGYFYTVLPDDNGNKNQVFIISALIAKSNKLYYATSENLDPELLEREDEIRDLTKENITVLGNETLERTDNKDTMSAPRQTKLKRADS